MRQMTILPVILALAAGAAVAAESVKPALPDPDYCSRRDADPKKCVIQDGLSPPPPIVREKPEQPSAPPVPEKPAEKAPSQKGR